MSDTNTPDKVTIDPSKLDLNELCEVEDIVGEPLGSMFSGGSYSAKAIRAIAYMVAKRDDPNVSIEDAGKVTIEQVDFGG